MLEATTYCVDMAAVEKPEPTIYVVDDEEHLLQPLTWLLSTVRYPVKTFVSGQEFLDFIQPDHPGCLILDNRMPGLSGLDVQERLRDRGIQLPVIMITAYGDVATAVRAMKNKAVDFLEKPVQDQVLLDCIREALERDARYRAERARQLELKRRIQELTPREKEVVRWVVQGMSSKETASELGVSFKTVEAHRASIMKKMKADSVAQLIHIWRDFQQNANEN